MIEWLEEEVNQVQYDLNVSWDFPKKTEEHNPPQCEECYSPIGLKIVKRIVCNISLRKRLLD